MANSETEVLDLEDRDTHKLNQHLEVTWESVIGEPPTVRSPECAWSLSRYCFKCSRQAVYLCLSVLCAPITACMVGISFACMQFQYIWCTTPCLRMWNISCGAYRQYVLGCTHGIVIPIMEAFGYILSQIRVRQGTLPENDELIKNREQYLTI